MYILLACGVSSWVSGALVSESAVSVFKIFLLIEKRFKWPYSDGYDLSFLESNDLNGRILKMTNISDFSRWRAIPLATRTGRAMSQSNSLLNKRRG